MEYINQTCCYVLYMFKIKFKISFVYYSVINIM